MLLCRLALNDSRLSMFGSSVTHLTSMQEFMAPAYRQRWIGDLPADAPVIPCVPLKAILAKFGMTHIDFFSLDVEGAELEVLRTLDFSAVHVNVFVIELDGSNPEKDQEVKRLLTANHYVLDGGNSTGLSWGSNGWFRHRSFKPSKLAGN